MTAVVDPAVGAPAIADYTGPIFGWPAMTSPGVARLTKYVADEPTEAQRVFLCTVAPEVFFGGAGGPGKSSGLLMSGLQFADVPGYAALFLRTETTQLTLPGALLDRLAGWLDGTDAKWREQKKQWVFPSGALLQFGYLSSHKDFGRYKSAEFQGIFLDETTEFDEWSYRMLFSRLRRPRLPCKNCRTKLVGSPVEGWRHELEVGCPTPAPFARAIRRYGSTPDGLNVFNIPLRMRSASNPGGPGHAFVKSRLVEAPPASGRVYIPARKGDNPHLDVVEYDRSLSNLPTVERMRIESGDWEVRDPGEIFDTTKITRVDWPWRTDDRAIRRVRYWDLAATEVKPGVDPDWTCGVRLARNDDTGLWLIEDVRIGRLAPQGVEQMMRAAAEMDGTDVRIYIEQEPGSSGKSVVSHYARHVLTGYRVHGSKTTGSKATRISLVEPVVTRGELSIVGAEWNQALLDQLDAWPNVTHDDIADALAGAHEQLSKKAGRLIS